MSSGGEPALGLYDGLVSTRAIRRFRDEPVDDADLAALLFAATRAPSGSNRQPFRFLVLRDGPRAVEAKALLGTSFRSAWAEKRRADGYATIVAGFSVRGIKNGLGLCLSFKRRPNGYAAIVAGLPMRRIQ